MTKTATADARVEAPPDDSPHKAVIVRTYSAGVFFGRLVHHQGQEVRLTQARRIWRWYGANTLSEIATKGLDAKQSRVAAPVDVVLTQAIEIIDCLPEAIACLEGAKWA